MDCVGIAANWYNALSNGGGGWRFVAFFSPLRPAVFPRFVGMGSVAVGSTMAMNSFSDHKFLVYPAGGWTVLKELTIFADRADYWLEFELEDADDGSASSVSHSAALSSPGERTGELELREKRQNDGLLRSFGTSVAVKFRNLSGRQVQLWYDDGRSGVRSSVIRPGRDATTNSYPGHVFCFTEMWLTELPGGGGCGFAF